MLASRVLVAQNMNKIKILYLTTSLNTYGPARALFNIATRLDPDQFETVFCQCEPENKGPVRTALQAKSIPIYDLNTYGPFDIRALFRLVRILRAERVDILHSRLIRADFYGRLAGRLAGTPLIITNLCDIYTEHFQAWHGKWRGRILYELDRCTLPLAHVFVANANGVRDDLVDNVGVPAGKVTRIYNGVDTQLYVCQPEWRRLIRQQLAIPLEACLIGVVARLNPKKSLSYLIEATNQLYARFEKFRLLIVGDGPERVRLEAQVLACGLGEVVTFTGERIDIPELLSVMDIFAFPSLFEGHPNALLEAMAAGLPCVASNIPGNNEVIIDGVTGYLVPVRDADALANMIAVLVGDPALRRTFGDESRRSVSERFNLDVMARQYEALYKTHRKA